MNQQMVDERQRRLMREADQYRLGRIGQIYRRSLTARLLANMGSWMVAEGTRLQARYEATKLNRPDAPPTGIIFS